MTPLAISMFSVAPSRGSGHGLEPYKPVAWNHHGHHSLPHQYITYETAWREYLGLTLELRSTWPAPFVVKCALARKSGIDSSQRGAGKWKPDSFLRCTFHEGETPRLLILVLLRRGLREFVVLTSILDETLSFRKIRRIHPLCDLCFVNGCV
ncbi:hypothetical protein B0T19DRAFT_24858 [Cercophora scortea]|uniref:Uncharacterized protein n=1 Tax=Cercophora scortea TaxID=314031 RepID=A0AAE0J341_9PEZI|nr:hypothetical protein B0T19DRAFT_24858 [Cercophora scortea]